MWKYTHTDELYHYGVLGMKWGMRRAAKQGVKYQYKSIGQKKYETKVHKLKQKPVSRFNNRRITRAESKLKMYKARDLNRVEYASKTSIGKAYVKQFLMGPIGSGSYSRFRSAGYGRAISALGSATPITSKIVENNAAKNRMKESGSKRSFVDRFAFDILVANK